MSVQPEIRSSPRHRTASKLRSRRRPVKEPVAGPVGGGTRGLTCLLEYWKAAHSDERCQSRIQAVAPPGHIWDRSCINRDERRTKKNANEEKCEHRTSNFEHPTFNRREKDESCRLFLSPLLFDVQRSAFNVRCSRSSSSVRRSRSSSSVRCW